MPYLASFACLWCGAAHTCRTPDDLEGWAQLCPTCVGKAGDNTFLRFRLRRALTERGAAGGSGAEAGVPAGAAGMAEAAAAPARAPDPETTPAVEPTPAGPVDLEAGMRDYYEARAPEYDDWYLRRGRYERGAIHDAAWHAELDMVGRWLDGLPLRGEIVELAAGTGWWSTLLASKGELSLYDTSPSALDLARERLVAHGLRAHLHVRDAWTEPDRQVDAVVAGFWLSHVDRPRLDDFLALVRRWLKPGGRFAAIDSLPDPQSGAPDQTAPVGDRVTRRLADGRAFSIIKVHYAPEELAAGLVGAGFHDIQTTTTGRFFVLVQATA